MKKLFFLLLLAFLSVTQAMAYDFEVGGIYYNVSGTNATVTYKDTNYNSYSGDKDIGVLSNRRNSGMWDE